MEVQGTGFTAGGLVGFTTVDDREPDSRSDTRVVRIDQACEVMASTETKLAASDAARRDAPAARPSAGCRQRAQRGGEESCW